MAASEYPANLATNSFILHDFAEIAYIVCTGATPASNNTPNDITAANTTTRVLARLKKAEKQFRQASILVALDTERLELFTFYKKVDVVKDQRAILSKFGYVCRLNSCIIAYKNASRIIELLKPDSARVYRLFTDAIMSSIQISPPAGPPIIPTKSRLIMMRANDLNTEADNCGLDGANSWYIHKLDIQIVPTGHVVLTVRRWFPDILQLLSAVEGSGRHTTDDLFHDSTLCLWPFGQLARFKRLAARSSDGQLSSKDKKTHEYWIQKIRSWLIEDHHDLGHNPNLPVVEAEIPVRVTGNQTQPPAEQAQWVPVLWPTELTYILPHATEKGAAQDDLDVSIDPLESAEEWFLHKGPAFERAMLKGEPMEVVEDNMDDGQLFDEDVHFESPQQFIQPITHPFAAQNTVYPTPPEASATQPTPGLSVDGLANTPLTTLPSSQGNHQHLSPSAGGHQNFDHTITRQDSGITQQTDEDLLSGVTDQTNNHNMTNDEPNWEFFDGPDFEATFDNELSKQQDLNMEDVAGPATEAGPGGGDPEDDAVATAVDDPKQSPQLGTNATHEDDMIEDIGEPQESQDQVAAQILNPVDVAPGMSPKLATNNTAASKVDSRITSVSSSTQHISSQEGHNMQQRPTLVRDRRYSIGGKYWFQPNLRYGKDHSIDPSTKATGNLDRHNDSESSAESADDASDVDSLTDTHRPWMHFQAPSAPMDTDTNNVTLEGTAEGEVNAIFDAIRSADGDDLLHLQTGRVKSSAPNTARTLAIAQVLVEQLANSSMIQDWAPASLPDQPSSSAFAVLFDNGGLRTETPCATLSELTSVQIPSSQPKVSSRVSKIDGSMVSLKRSDEEMFANASILQFWDTLNLQPLSDTKNVQALCLHPKGSNYAHGAEAFLSRVGESYTACNFGKHQPLDLPGMHNIGLISWSEDESSAQSLERVCENVGTSLSSEDIASDCIVVYIIIPDNDIEKCFQVCSAFFELFECFKRGRRATLGDVALQLIPASFVASSKTLVIPPQRRFLDLAAEVYERLPSDKELSFAGSTFPHALVARLSNPVFEFELSTKAASPLSKPEEPCHLAYAISSDGRWLVATWSDELGKIALSMSYWVKDSDGGAKRSRLDILRHVCEVTSQIMANRRAKWWLCVARVGFYEAEELQEWLYLSSQLCDNNKMISRVVLLGIELRPRLTLSSSKAAKPPVSNPQPIQPLHNVQNTPVSTPQPTAITSPEQVVPVTPTSATLPGFNAQTPPESGADSILDNDLTLHDPLHDVWLATLPFGLNQSLNFLEVRPALASGFLIKRTSGSDSSQVGNPAVLGVNLVATPKQPPNLLSMAERESLLRDILTQFRNMCTLTMIRRSPNAQNHCVPWHLATAYKGANILEALM